jgi:hypothetical protein
MDAELKSYLEKMEARLIEATEQARAELGERIEATETKLLSAFYDWARPVDIRLRTLPMIEERLGLLEERISKIERGDHA